MCVRSNLANHYRKSCGSNEDTLSATRKESMDNVTHDKAESKTASFAANDTPTMPSWLLEMTEYYIILHITFHPFNNERDMSVTISITFYPSLFPFFYPLYSDVEKIDISNDAKSLQMEFLIDDQRPFKNITFEDDDT